MVSSDFLLYVVLGTKIIEFIISNNPLLLQLQNNFSEILFYIFELKNACIIITISVKK